MTMFSPLARWMMLAAGVCAISSSLSDAEAFVSSGAAVDGPRRLLSSLPPSRRSRGFGGAPSRSISFGASRPPARFRRRRGATATRQTMQKSSGRLRFSSLGGKATTVLRLSDGDDDGGEDFDPRDDFGRSIRSFRSSALKTAVEVGDTVVCKRSLPNLGIYENSSYEVRSLYAQRFDEETQRTVRRPLGSLDGDAPAGAGERVYLTLFSPKFHSEAVVVTAEEVGLVTVREELGSAVWLALPGFFWVLVIASFYNTYHERTGGSFGDAFWGR